MRKLMYILSIPVLVFIVIGFRNTTNDDIDVSGNWNGLIFERSEGLFGEITITGTTPYFDPTKELVLPTTYNGRPIRRITEGAFRQMAIEKVDFSRIRHLRVIESHAFYSNRIVELDLSMLRELRYIETGAFRRNGSITKETLNIEGLSDNLVIQEDAFDFEISIQDVHYIAIVVGSCTLKEKRELI